MHPFHRTELLVGRPGFARLQAASACVIGLGGVGSYAAEALVRAGLGHVSLVDFDEVCVTNLNRQLHATRDTVGQRKAELMGDRARAINPKCDVRVLPLFYNRATHAQILDRDYDIVLDCIDNMTAKIFLLGQCVSQGRPVISAMGAGGRLDPTRVQVGDIGQTHTDPFARIVRENLRVLGITEGVRCVWTDEPPQELDEEAQAAFRCICPNRGQNQVHSCEHRLQVQGSCSWMPPIFGLTMAGAVVNELLGRSLRGVPRPTRGRRQSPAPGKIPGDRKRALLAQAGFGRAGSATDDERR